MVYLILLKGARGLKRAFLLRMKITRHLLIAGLACFLPLTGQDRQPVVSKDSIWVNTVERGNMPLLERASGLLTSLQPVRAVVAFSDNHAARCEAGRSVKALIEPSPKPIAGKVVRSSQDGGCEIELSEPVPEGTTIGGKVGALIEVGELKDVVFFGRPVDSSANSEGTIFAVEPGSSFARRLPVRYGKASGSLIQILGGLVPGDRVIASDMSKWAAYGRVRLQ